MKVFNEKNFEELLTNCKKYPEYRGLIVLSSSSRITEFADELSRCDVDFLCTKSHLICHGVDVAKLCFKNDSFVDVYPPFGVELRGRRYDEILVERVMFENNNIINHLRCLLYERVVSAEFKPGLPPDSETTLPLLWKTYDETEYLGSLKTKLRNEENCLEDLELTDFLNEFKINDRDCQNTTTMI